MARSINQKPSGYNTPKLILKASTKRRNRRYGKQYIHQAITGEPKKEIPAYKRCDDLWNYD